MTEEAIQQRRMLIHGLEGSSLGYKARFMRGLFPDMVIPDFSGCFVERMKQLASVLGTTPGWIIVGSSFGGLMGAFWTCRHPHQVDKLVLLAPALSRPEFAGDLALSPVDVPTVIYHGKDDIIVPLEPVEALARKYFKNLEFHAVDDNHVLRNTMPNIDWRTLLGTPKEQQSG